MTFRRQLIIGHLISFVLVGSIAIAAVVALHVTSASEGAIARELSDQLARVQQLRYEAEQVVATSRGYLLTGEARYRERFESVSAEFEAGIRELEAGHLDREGQRRVTAVERAARTYTEAATLAAKQRSTTSLIPFFDDTLVPRRDALEASIVGFADYQRGVFDAALHDAQSRAHEAQLVVLFAASLAIMLGVGLAWLTIRKSSAQFERMRAAQDAAHAAAAAREDMLAIVSHDLRNPLSTIVMSSSLLEETSSDERTRHRAQVMRRASERMAHMIDELLETARIEAGTLVLHREPCATKRIVDETLELFDGPAAERAVRLRAECDDMTVVADPDRIVEVLSNLIGNALKFTPAGGEIVVKAVPDEHAVRFAVSDTGPGIAADQISHLFDRYWQGAGKRGGLGLGLYICKRLVEAHHGTIGIDTQLGAGSTFWFTVPTQTPAEA